MRFSKLVISNFRSIGQDGITINFAADRQLAAIIGANASGKSNVLAALGVVLGVYPYSRFQPASSDFHQCKTDGHILIELHFDPPLIDHDVYRREYRIGGFRYRAAHRGRNPDAGTLLTEHYCFDEAGQTLVKPTRMFRRKGQVDDGVENTPRPVLVGDQVYKLGRIFYLDAPSLERFFDKTTGYNPLARLFELYRSDFDGDHNTYSAGDKIMPSREAFEKFSQRLAQILRTKKLAEIEKGLSRHIADYLGISGSDPLSIQFALPSHREIFERLIDLQVSEGEHLPPLPIEYLGSGYRALMRLAVLETLLEMQENNESVLLIEEPEIYLHVHLRRYFYGVLRNLANKGHPTIYTTHAPEFVDLTSPHEIIRLERRQGGQSTAHQVSEVTKFDFARIRRKLQRTGNEEMFFAHHALLTEGQDDQGVVQELLERKGIDPNVHSISVINCDGVEQIKSYVSLCKELGIDFYVIHDQDDDTNPSIKKRNDQLAAAVGGDARPVPSLHVFRPTLESALGTTKQSDNLDHLLQILGDYDYPTISERLPELVKPIEEFAQTRSFAPARA